MKHRQGQDIGNGIPWINLCRWKKATGRARSSVWALGTAPCTPWGGPRLLAGPPSCVPALLRVFQGHKHSGTRSRGCAEELLRRRIPGKADPHLGITCRAQFPGELHSTPAPGVQHPLPGQHRPPLSLPRVPRGHRTRRVSIRLLRSTSRWLSPARPRRSSLRREAAAAPGCWQRCRAGAWAAAGTNPALPGLRSQQKTP